MIVRHVLSNWIVHASYTSTARKLADADTDAFLDYDPGLHQTQGNHKEPVKVVGWVIDGNRMSCIADNDGRRLRDLVPDLVPS
jgi:hypothetical protein